MENYQAFSEIDIAIVTYLFAIFFFIGEVNRFLDFCPLVFHDALKNMKCIPFFDLFKIYFQDFIEMLFPVGVLAASTEFIGIIRIFTKGLGRAIKKDIVTGDYELVNVRNNETVGYGNDSGVRDLYRIFGAVLCIAVAVPIMFILKPFFIVWYVIQTFFLFKKKDKAA